MAKRTPFARPCNRPTEAEIQALVDDALRAVDFEERRLRAVQKTRGSAPRRKVAAR